MRLVMLSDTHGRHELVKVPKGDILIHAGDLTNVGKLFELKQIGDWLQKQHDNFEHVICIAGNHDFACEHFMQANEEQMMRNNYFGKVHYLRDSGVKLNGLQFYGSPWQPEFMNWAFNVPRGPEIRKYWDLIPEDTDVLITHGPPRGILDQAAPHHHSECLGCDDLFDVVERINPKIHVFGHIHGGHGQTQFGNGTRFFNASVVNEAYKVVHVPFVVEIDNEKEKQ